MYKVVFVVLVRLGDDFNLEILCFQYVVVDSYFEVWVVDIGVVGNQNNVVVILVKLIYFFM